jgi:hypothetical protein
MSSVRHIDIGTSTTRAIALLLFMENAVTLYMDHPTTSEGLNSQSCTFVPSSEMLLPMSLLRGTDQVSHQRLDLSPTFRIQRKPRQANQPLRCQRQSMAQPDPQQPSNGLPPLMHQVLFGNEGQLRQLNASLLIHELAGGPELRASRDAALAALRCCGRPPLRTVRAALTPGQCRRLRCFIDANAVAGAPESIDGLPEWQVLSPLRRPLRPWRASQSLGAAFLIPAHLQEGIAVHIAATWISHEEIPHH